MPVDGPRSAKTARPLFRDRAVRCDWRLAALVGRISNPSEGVGRIGNPSYGNPSGPGTRLRAPPQVRGTAARKAVQQAEPALLRHQLSNKAPHGRLRWLMSRRANGGRLTPDDRLIRHRSHATAVITESVGPLVRGELALL